ncbi:MAG: class I SAM-dependent methyltransferase [Patescibacteria group bacterium]|nr:class I SAM-dependent methyltransferase [Patescibacteria group bacterium]
MLKDLLKRAFKNKNLSLWILRRLFYLHDWALHKIVTVASLREGGIHPKHRLTEYHDFFLNNIEPSHTVLDIGCGNGILTREIAKKAKRVVGIDMNKTSIEYAKSHCALPNVEYIVADATQYSFNEKFDRVVVSNVLEHIDDRTSLLKQIKNICDIALIRVPMINRDWLVPYKKELGLEYRLDRNHFIEYTFNDFSEELNSAGMSISDYKINWGEIWAVVRCN